MREIMIRAYMYYSSFSPYIDWALVLVWASVVNRGFDRRVSFLTMLVVSFGVYFFSFFFKEK
jgi:hypothetical protein